MIGREGKWFVASCPILDLANQGRNEKEAKENMSELIQEYLKDPDTRKPSLDELLSLSLANVSVNNTEGALNRKAPRASTT